MLTPVPHRASRLGDERGFTLIELLVAMVAGLVVVAALLAILAISLRQDTSISDRVQADRSGRSTLNTILEDLHSSCTGFGSTAIQAPSTTPVSPLGATGGANLWFLSAAGNPTSTSAAVSAIVQHDILWQATKVVNASETLGTLTDYSFTGSGESPNWKFPALSTANATSRVLATNVVPLSSGTVFHYWRYNTTTGKLVEVPESELASVATSKKVAQVTVSYKQAPSSGNTEATHTTTFSASAVLRFTPPEGPAEGTTCT